MPDWTFDFHGKGCCLTHKFDRTVIDVDFDDQGNGTRIDRFFYRQYLRSLQNPDLPEWILTRPEPLENFWQADLPSLETLGLWRDFRITPLGEQLAEALHPIVEKLSALHRENTPNSRQQILYLSLQLNDPSLAIHFSADLHDDSGLKNEILKCRQEAREARANHLFKIIHKHHPEDTYLYLQAIAELGPDLARFCVMHCLHRSPVDSAGSVALDILKTWQPEDFGTFSFDDVLEDLVRVRARELSRSSIRLFWPKKLWNPQFPDETSRNYQVLKLSSVLLARQGTRIKPETRKGLVQLIQRAALRYRGATALHLYVLDRKLGMALLMRSFARSVRYYDIEAVAACVLIGTEDTRHLLLETLAHPKLELQHAAACGLLRFPSPLKMPELEEWLKRVDGMPAPAQEKFNLEGASFGAYTVGENSHGNMMFRIDWDLEKFRELRPLLEEIRGVD